MAVRRPLDPASELLEGFDGGCHASEYLVGALPARIWRADPPEGEGRTVAAIVAHMQSVRRTFAKMGGAPSTPSLDRLRATPAEARRALKESRLALTALFRSALDDGRGRVKGMPRRTVNMMLYLLQHEAHHRGQICLLARTLGHRLSADDAMRIWGWKKMERT